MKKRLMPLFGLIFCGSLAFGQMQGDTCLAKVDVQAARLYVRYLENYKRQSDVEVAMLRLKTDEQSSSTAILNNQNNELASTLKAQKRYARHINWGYGILGTALGAGLVALFCR